VANWWKGLFGGGTAIATNRKNPAMQAAVHRSAQIYQDIPLHEFITEAERQELARDLFLEINRICNAKVPQAVCRQSLAETMLKFSQYQVLVIPPPPEADPSGLRGQPGISGELQGHLVELAQRAENLRADLFGTTTSITFDSVWQIVQTLYWKSFWRLETINATRIEIGDHNKNGDWFRPFMHAACASAEHRYRSNLDLPPAFDPELAKPVSTAYSIYTDIVISGTSDPDAEWRDYYKDSNIPLPHFDRQST
jgi:hypothetical protein